MLESVKAMWDSYSTRLFARTQIGETQYTETRRAFYGGVFAMLCACRRAGDPDIHEDAGVAYMQDMWDEVAAFYSEVVKGRA